jgi:DNA primase
MHNSLKEKILESVDIVEVVGERVSLKRKGHEYVGLCPFHDDHRPSLSVSPRKQIFKCWSCGAGGDVIKFVQLLQRVEFKDALEILARRAGIELRRASSGGRSAQTRDQIRQALTWARTHFQRNLWEMEGGKRTAAYARGRGMTDETIGRFGLGYAPDAWDDLLSHALRAGISRDVLQQAGLVTVNESGKVYDRFRNRLVFPICDALGRCIAFGGRALGDDPAKYLNSPETALFSKSRVLYGLDLARQAITTAREAIVVEGYTDVVLLSQAGVGNVVATLGTALTDAHAKMLSTLSDRIVMCFDSDEAGLRAADRAVETALRQRTEVLVAVMPDGKDPADFVIGHGTAAFKSLLQSALGALEFNWSRTVQAYSGRGRQGQRDALEAFLRFVARVTLAGGIDPLEQGLLVGRLGELLPIPAGTVYELLAKAKATAARESAPRSTPDTSERSAYEESIRGLPAGLVAAVEEAFGLALSASERFGELGEALAGAAGHCQPWSRLYETLERLAREPGSYTRADVIKSCDDSLLCELVGRASERIAARPVSTQRCQAVSERLRSELAALRHADLRATLRGKAAEEGSADYEALLAVAKRQRGRDAKPPILFAE